MRELRIGFVSTRLAGTDGVSLEADKWSDVLAGMGHACFYMAGELDRPAEHSFCVPECHFTHPDIRAIHDGCFGSDHRDVRITERVEAVKHILKKRLREFVGRFDLDLLIPENALTIPLNLPLGLALTEFLLETTVPSVAHHHDFFWERKRFVRNCCWDYLHAAFPPHLLRMQHAVLNSSQDHQLSLRKGVSAMIVPNVMDFDQPPPPPDGYGDDLREVLGIGAGEKLILQPTRVVQRKGIEHAVELTHRLKMPAVLVISHSSGDEGDEYACRVREYAELLGVKLAFCFDRIGDRRGRTPDGGKIYSLDDLYRQADLVTYPSVYEGFGNGFLEAVYHRCPIVVNNYSIYNHDIKPKGFETIEMDGYVSERTVRMTRQLLSDPGRVAEMAEHNYALCRLFFSYTVLRNKLTLLLMNRFGTNGMVSSCAT